MSCFDFQRNAYNRASASSIAWNISAEVLSAIAQKQSIYEQKYFICSNIATSSPSTTTDRNTAWTDLKKLVVSLYNDYIINNDAISDADKKAMHVHTLEGNNTTLYDAPNMFLKWNNIDK